jgi:hypothetical protein
MRRLRSNDSAPPVFGSGSTEKQYSDKHLPKPYLKAQSSSSDVGKYLYFRLVALKPNHYMSNEKQFTERGEAQRLCGMPWPGSIIDKLPLPKFPIRFPCSVKFCGL